MRIVLVVVGKVKERGIREAIDDYAKRISRYGRYEEIELKDGNEAEVTARFEKAIPERAFVIAMEVLGKGLTSEQLARQLETVAGRGISEVAFLIGGSYGLPESISKRADLQLSLSKMTLPHRLARLLLAEQVYRAFTITRGEPYSH